MTLRLRSGHARETAYVTLAYAAIAVVMTWPLAAGMTRDVAWDLGDSVLNMWILAWDCEQLRGILQGHYSHLRHFFDANIFHPAPLTLAYSEHLIPQAIQVLPIYALTRNPILCYNLLFLSTFVLSGLGMFLFARELTGSEAAAFVAGLAFAFTPYRVASIPHLQVLSAAWMPFVCYGFRRYIVTRRPAALAGAAAAWILQNLSCGYYLLFFSPVAVAYAVWELVRSGLWRDRRVVVHMALAVVVVAAATIPFLIPYVELRRLGFSPRSLDETRRFSADVYGYLTADPNLRLWGPIAQAWPHAEGLLFPGLTIAALAAIGAVRESRLRIRSAAMLPGLAWAAMVVALLLNYSIRLPGLKMTSLSRVLMAGALAAATLAAVSGRTRATVAA